MSTCKSCGAPIRWVTSETTGRQMPLDAEPSEQGNVLILTEGTDLLFGQDRGRVLGKAADREAADGPLYLSHFATCPQSAVHRRPS